MSRPRRPWAGRGSKAAALARRKRARPSPAPLRFRIRRTRSSLVVSSPARDVLSPREVADRAGFSYTAVLRAIRRGDLAAFEPVPGHYRIELAEYERWLRRPARREASPPEPEPAQNYMAWLRRRQQLGHAAVPDDVKLCEFVETYWRLHAIPNLSQASRDLYGRVWALHILPRLGDYGVRELTPKRLTRFRAELERAGVGAATVVKAMTIVQSILSFAVGEELVEYNAAAGVTKPRYARAREPHIFLPTEIEAIRATVELRDATLVSTLCLLRRPTRRGRLPPYLGRHRRAGDPVRGHQAPQDALHASTEASRGGPSKSGSSPADVRSPSGLSPRPRRRVLGPGRLAQLAPARWHGEPERPRNDRKQPTPPRPGCAPAGTRPRDLRSSYVTLRVYEGVPLTQIAREVGTSVRMIEQHYAGVIANWDGKQRPAEASIRAARKASIRAARQTSGRGVDAQRTSMRSKRQ